MNTARAHHDPLAWPDLPIAMDGVARLNQPSIQPAKTVGYEFAARRPDTFMYHPQADRL